jgi:sugar phosphate isomerase/epimerase
LNDAILQVRSPPAPTHDEVLDAAAELGARVVFEPMAHRNQWTSADAVRKMAGQLNRAAAAAESRGLAVGYHNHSYEFHHAFDGVSAYEVFVAEFDAQVMLELDVYWAQVAGQQVPELLGRHGDRVTALHVEDGRVDTDPFLTGDVGAAALGQVPAGHGAVPLEEILSAAAGIEYAVVEFDAYDGDVFDGIAGTVAYLAERGIR